MKAAVLHQFGEAPRYEDFPDPTLGEGQILVQVKAVALENIDKMMADGSHFASRQFLSTLPAIVGFDGNHLRKRQKGRTVLSRRSKKAQRKTVRVKDAIRDTDCGQEVRV